MPSKLILILLLPLTVLTAVSSHPALATDLAQAGSGEPTANVRSFRKTNGSRGMSSRNPNVPSDLPDSEPSIRPNLPLQEPSPGKDTDTKDQDSLSPTDPK